MARVREVAVKEVVGCAGASVAKTGSMVIEAAMAVVMVMRRRRMRVGMGVVIAEMAFVSPACRR